MGYTCVVVHMTGLWLRKPSEWTCLPSLFKNLEKRKRLIYCHFCRLLSLSYLWYVDDSLVSEEMVLLHSRPSHALLIKSPMCKSFNIRACVSVTSSTMTIPKKLGAVEPWWAPVEFVVCCKTICCEGIGKEDERLLYLSISTVVVVYLLEVDLYPNMCLVLR